MRRKERKKSTGFGFSSSSLTLLNKKKESSKEIAQPRDTFHSISAILPGTSVIESLNRGFASSLRVREGSAMSV